MLNRVLTRMTVSQRKWRNDVYIYLLLYVYSNKIKLTSGFRFCLEKSNVHLFLEEGQNCVNWFSFINLNNFWRPWFISSIKRYNACTHTLNFLIYFRYTIIRNKIKINDCQLYLTRISEKESLKIHLISRLYLQLTPELWVQWN